MAYICSNLLLVRYKQNKVIFISYWEVSRGKLRSSSCTPCRRPMYEQGRTFFPVEKAWIFFLTSLLRPPDVKLDTKVEKCWKKEQLRTKTSKIFLLEFFFRSALRRNRAIIWEAIQFLSDRSAWRDIVRPIMIRRTCMKVKTLTWVDLRCGIKSRS